MKELTDYGLFTIDELDSIHDALVADLECLAAEFGMSPADISLWSGFDQDRKAAKP